MAVRPVHVLFISLRLYELASGDYCKNGFNSSIQFCQRGTISGSKLYINGSSVKTRNDLMDRGCVCYLEQNGTRDILVNAGASCVFCGLYMNVGNSYFRSNMYDSQTHGWGLITLNDTKFTITLGLDATIDKLTTAFCITIEENKQDSSVVLNLTCEELAARPSVAISTSPNVITTPPTMVPDTTKSMSPTSTENANSTKTETTMLPNTTKSMSPTSTENAKPTKIETTMVADTTKSMSPMSTKTAIETTNPTAVIAGNTNGTHGPNATVATATTTKPTITTTTTGNDPKEPRVDNQKEVIIPAAAAGGGAGVLVILAIVIVVCCLRKKRKHAEDPIYMKESERSDAIMTDNAAYGIYIDTNTNPFPHVQAQCTGDVYSVVNKEGTSNVCPSVNVPRMQVGETGDVYAIVNKTTVRDIPNIEHSREKSAKSRIQTKSDNNNVTFDMRPSTDYADITIDNSCV